MACVIVAASVVLIQGTGVNAWFAGGLALLALWGTGLGQALTQGSGAAARYVLTSLLGTCAALACGLFLVTGPAPAVTEVVEMDEADRERLGAVFRDALESRSESAALELHERDVNLLASRWLAAVDSDSRGRVELTRDRVTVEISRPLEVPLVGRRHVNAAAVTEFGADASAGVEVVSARVGHVPVPGRLLTEALLTAAAIGLGRTVSDVEALAGDVRVAREEVRISTADSAAWRLLAEDGSGAGSPELWAGVGEYCEELRSRVPDMPVGDERFIGLVQAAFALARQRSEEQRGDPVEENRQALVALGVLAGDTRIKRWLPAGDVAAPQSLVWHELRVTTLRGRLDLVRHFLISAAMTAMTTRSLADGAGWLKEEFDAGEGGSGFSASDLLADRAGIRLARRATGDQARHVQEAFRGAVTIEDLFPGIDDLPEGLTQAEVTARYGGVTDERFERLLAELDRRLDRCRLLAR
jgi:hypothetical protein